MRCLGRASLLVMAAEPKKVSGAHYISSRFPPFTHIFHPAKDVTDISGHFLYQVQKLAHSKLEAAWLAAGQRSLLCTAADTLSFEAADARGLGSRLLFVTGLRVFGFNPHA